MFPISFLNRTVLLALTDTILAVCIQLLLGCKKQISEKLSSESKIMSNLQCSACNRPKTTKADGLMSMYHLDGTPVKCEVDTNSWTVIGRQMPGKGWPDQAESASKEFNACVGL